MRTLTKSLATAAAGGALALSPMAPATAAPVVTGGFVNVTVVDVVDVENVLNENNVAIGLVADVVANVCPALSVQDVTLLAVAAQRGETVQNVDCDATGGGNELTITQVQRR